MNSVRDTCFCGAPATGHDCEEYYEGRCASHADVERDDLLRRQFVAELWKLHAESGRINMIDSLYEYERLVKERIK